MVVSDNLRGKLTDIWVNWCVDNEVECISADELLMVSAQDVDSPTLDEEQIAFVLIFIEMWEIVYNVR